MNKYFNVFLEFDKEIVHRTIEKTISENGKGYVCAIESNNLAIANKNKDFNDVVNHSLINICDGSNIAWLLGRLYKKEFHSYTGNSIFMHFVNQKKFKQYFLGNTAPILKGLQIHLAETDPSISNMIFKELPFRKVEEFDYPEIAREINENKPDLIWISLGAPKQEIFMSMLLPYLNRGVMVGIGAAFNFNAHIGPVKRAPSWMRNMRLEWLYRALEEPKKNIPRYWNFIKLLPGLFIRERKLSKPIQSHLPD